MNNNVLIKKVHKEAKMPTRGSDAAAGYDLYAALVEKVIIAPHTMMKIPTGLSFELPEGTFGAIFARSGLATKEGLRPANCVGVIDSDYRGQVMVALYNDADEWRTIEPQERIAQLVLLPFIEINFVEATDLSDTERGIGGFGSTGSL